MLGLLMIFYLFILLNHIFEIFSHEYVLLIYIYIYKRNMFLKRELKLKIAQEIIKEELDI